MESIFTRMSVLRGTVGTLALLGALTLGGSPARAAFIPLLVGETNNGNGTFTYSYQAKINPEIDARTGDYVTMYDFAGLVAGSATASTGWTASVHNVGITPAGVLPTDDPTLPNITITRTADKVSGPAIFSFSATSTFGTQGAISFTSSASRMSGSLAGSKVAAIGLVEGPSAVTTASVELPEPGSLWLLATGLPIGLVLRRRWRRALA